MTSQLLHTATDWVVNNSILSLGTCTQALHSNAAYFSIGGGGGDNNILSWEKSQKTKPYKPKVT